MRSRAVSLPRWCWRSTAAALPACSACSRSSASWTRRSSIGCGRHRVEGTFVAVQCLGFGGALEVVFFSCGHRCEVTGAAARAPRPHRKGRGRWGRGGWIGVAGV